MQHRQRHRVQTTAKNTFWNLSPADVLVGLHGRVAGLPGAEAERRLRSRGPNLLRPRRHSGVLWLFGSQFKSPLVLLLLFAASLSFFLHEHIEACIILSIVSASGLLGFWQEHRATRAVEGLLALVQIKVMVLRDGQQVEVPCEQVVPGDLVVLNAGDVVPGDCRLIESKNLFVDEAVLTGETFPLRSSCPRSRCRLRSPGAQTACSWARTSSAARPQRSWL
jgi:Mg2+-importing ATPase